MALMCICVLLHLLVLLRVDSLPLIQSNIGDKSGPPGQLTASDKRFILNKLSDYCSQNWGNLFKPGTADQHNLVISHSGKVFWFRLLVYGALTCQLLDTTPQAYVKIGGLVKNELIPAIKKMVDGGSNCGFAVRQKVSFDFFELPPNAALQPDSGLPSMNRILESNVTSDTNDKPASTASTDARQFTRPSKSRNVTAPTSSTEVGHQNDVNTTGNYENFPPSTAVEAGRRKALESGQNKPLDSQGNCNVFFTTLFTNAGCLIPVLRTINTNKFLRSSDARFFFIMQPSCDLQLSQVDGRGGSNVIWRSKTENQGIHCFATLEFSGVLTIRDMHNKLVWSTPNSKCSSGKNCWTSSVLTVQTDGNVVLYRLGNPLQPVWDTQHHPSL